jgi:hypothetical protein
MRRTGVVDDTIEAAVGAATHYTLDNIRALPADRGRQVVFINDVHIAPAVVCVGLERKSTNCSQR